MVYTQVGGTYHLETVKHSSFPKRSILEGSLIVKSLRTTKQSKSLIDDDPKHRLTISELVFQAIL